MYFVSVAVQSIKLLSAQMVELVDTLDSKGPHGESAGPESIDDMPF